MKIKGAAGIGNSQWQRLTRGTVVAVVGDDLILRKRPDMPYDSSYCGEFYRQQLLYSARIISFAIPQEVEGAHNWQVNSNDTWKDALTRAQFGTLMRVIGPDGEEYFPADHSCGTDVAPEEPEMWTLFEGWSHSVDGNVADVVALIPAGAQEIMIQCFDLRVSVAGIYVLSFSVDGGATFFTTSTDYDFIGADGSQAASGSVILCGAPTNADRGWIGFIRSVNLGEGFVFCHSPFWDKCLYRLKASSLPVNALRIRGNAGGNLTKGNIRFWWR